MSLDSRLAQNIDIALSILAIYIHIQDKVLWLCVLRSGFQKCGSDFGTSKFQPCAENEGSVLNSFVKIIVSGKA